jgi:hypothetical protein
VPRGANAAQKQHVANTKLDGACHETSSPKK